MPRFVIDVMKTVPSIKVYEMYGLVGNCFGGIFAYLPFELAIPEGDFPSLVASRLIEAAGDTEAEIQGGDTSFYLLELDDTNQEDFDLAAKNNELYVIKMCDEDQHRDQGKIIGYATKDVYSISILVAAMNNREIVVPHDLVLKC